MAATPPSFDSTASVPPFPPLHGGVSLIQGRYGQRGNFELVAPDVRDGLWVFWFDNDEPGPGVWSSGLRFAEGRRFDDVCMAQSSHGPNHLEVIARSETRVHRYRWSPDLGFTEEEPLPAPPAAGRVSLVEAADGLLHAAVPVAASGVARLVADPSAYPRLSWTHTGTACPGEHVTAAALVPDPSGAGTRLYVLADGTVRRLDGGAGASAGGDSDSDSVDGGADDVGNAGTGLTRVLAHAAVAAPDGSCRVIAVTAGPEDTDTLRLRVWSDDDPATAAEAIALPGREAVTSLAATTASFDPGRIDVAVQRGDGIIHLRVA